MDLLTDIQKAIIKQICEAIAPPGNDDLDRFIIEADVLSKFFYSNTNHSGVILEYMQELGYVPEEVILENPDIDVPELLILNPYACEAHCYYEPSEAKLFDEAIKAGFIYATANKINRSKNILYPSKQSFYLHPDLRCDKVLEEIIEKNKISSVKVSLPAKVDWSNFYNIEIHSTAGKEILKFHKVRDTI